MFFQDSKTKKYAESLILFFLSVYVLVNPLPHTTTVQEICFYGALLLFVGVNGIRWIKFSEENTPLFVSTILFVGWIVFGLTFAVDKQNSMHDIYSHLFRYVLLCILFIFSFDTLKKIRILSWLFLFSVVSFVSYSLLVFYVVDGNDFTVRFFGNSQGMTYNLINIPIIFSIFFVLCNTVVATNKYHKVLFLLLLVPLVAALVLTQARSAFLALAISCCMFLFFYKKKLIPIIVLISAMILAFTPLKDRFNQDVSTNLRLNHALLVLEVVKDYPLTGIGFGMETFGYSLDLDSYKNKFEKMYNVNYGYEVVLNDPHNLYTDILVRTGLPGLALYMFFVFSLFKMLWKVIMSDDPFIRVWSLGAASSLVAYFVIGFFEPVFSHMHEFYFMLMVSLAAILWKRHNCDVINLSRVQ